MAYAVKVDGKLIIDTVYEHEELAKAHWLVNFSGDYDDSDFNMVPDRLVPAEEFKKCPEAKTVRVTVNAIELVH